jgi:hypothetical protein
MATGRGGDQHFCPRATYLGRPAKVDPDVAWAKFAAMAEGARNSRFYG